VSFSLPALARPDPRIALGLVGLAAAVALRVQVAGADGARSIVAGLVFGVVVAGLAAVTRARSMPSAALRPVVAGVLGAAVLCVPAALRHTDGLMPALPLNGYLPWALGVVVVAVAEEALLRGSLFTALQDRAGTAAAIGVTSLAFALLHVPLYGLGVLPLDLAVGVWLGTLRATTASVTAPALAHALADLAGWWLR
jgi:membrane protease YdiL (CAAX protease family)